MFFLMIRHKTCINILLIKPLTIVRLMLKTFRGVRSFLTTGTGALRGAVTKRPTMCDSYGLTFYGIQKYVKLEGHVDWVDKEKQGGAITELARAIKNGLETSLILPNEERNILKLSARLRVILIEILFILCHPDLRWYMLMQTS